MYAAPRGELAAPATATRLDDVHVHAAGEHEGGAVEGGIYTCDYGCGYLATYEDVVEHEKACPAGNHWQRSNVTDQRDAGATPPNVAPPVQGGNTTRETPAVSTGVSTDMPESQGADQGGSHGATNHRDTITAQQKPPRSSAFEDVSRRLMAPRPRFEGAAAAKRSRPVEEAATFMPSMGAGLSAIAGVSAAPSVGTSADARAGGGATASGAIGAVGTSTSLNAALGSLAAAIALPMPTPIAAAQPPEPQPPEPPPPGFEDQHIPGGGFKRRRFVR